MAAKKHTTKPLHVEFVPFHISTFEERGVWFARAEEFQIMGHGQSQADSERIVFHMVLQAVFLAASEGRLRAILDKAGIKVRVGIPEAEPATSGTESVWCVTLPQAA
jgi:hypothetical protein